MTQEQKDKCKKIYEHYGAEKQRRQLVEECAELIQAITKLERAAEGKSKFNLTDAKLNLIEEIADVEIMLSQIQGGVFKDGELRKNRVIDTKLDRQLERIAREVAAV